MTPNELTSEEMRRRREALGWTRVDLAVKMGSTSSRVTRMENKGFLSVDEQRSAFCALAGGLGPDDDWAEVAEEETEPEDPHAWLTTVSPGDDVVVIVRGSWIKGRYKLASVGESGINCIDQRNGASRTFRPENVRPA